MNEVEWTSVTQGGILTCPPPKCRHLSAASNNYKSISKERRLEFPVESLDRKRMSEQDGK